MSTTEQVIQHLATVASAMLKSHQDILEYNKNQGKWTTEISNDVKTKLKNVPVGTVHTADCFVCKTWED